MTIPWGLWVYVKKEQASELGRPFRKLTELAEEAIWAAELPAGVKMTVLFDAFYLCPTVTDACIERGWHYIGVGEGNRRFTPLGTTQSRRLNKYGRNLLSRKGQWHSVRGLKSQRRYRLAHRTGHLKGLGKVKVVFSRRRGDNSRISLVTNDLRAAKAKIVADDLKRWAIELLIKDEKQHLGMGDYRVLRYQAVVSHLHLVDIAYACLTRLALDEQDAQGRSTRKQQMPLRLPPISQRKTRMRQVVWRDAVENVIKKSHERPVIRRLERLIAA